MPLKNPNLPRARIITGYGEPFWIVFDGPAYRGSGRCNADNSLPSAYKAWQAAQPTNPSPSANRFAALCT